MPIVPTQDIAYPENSIVTLPAYARHIQSCECAFFGVNQSGCVSGSCQNIWKKSDRDWVRYYLGEAQFEIESYLHYTIGRRWQVDERHKCKTPIITRQGYIIAGGVQGETTLEAGAAVNHATDPATVGPIATTVTDARELHVFHINTDLEVIPSGITISGGNVTFEIPRCRLVKPEFEKNPDDGWPYSDLTYFASTVDVKRIYNDISTQATRVHTKSCDCSENTANLCIYVNKDKIASVDVGTASACGCCNWLDLNYYAGRPIMDVNGYYNGFGQQAQDTIMRLAHVKMPHEPCGCDPARDIWNRDRGITVDGRNRNIQGSSPFGPQNGAIIAWQFVNSPGMMLKRGYTL
jgi:hypothetical protein